MDITAIKARLGSIAPSKMNTFPGGVQHLLLKDVPFLLEYVGILEDAFRELERITHGEGYSEGYSAPSPGSSVTN